MINLTQQQQYLFVNSRLIQQVDDLTHTTYPSLKGESINFQCRGGIPELSLYETIGKLLEVALINEEEIITSFVSTVRASVVCDHNTVWKTAYVLESLKPLQINGHEFVSLLLQLPQFKDI